MPGKHIKIGQSYTLLDPAGTAGLSPVGWCILITLIVFSAFGVTGGGVAWWMFAQNYNNYYWTATGTVEDIGATTFVSVGCTNATLAAGTIKIKNHRTVSYLYTCPEPRSTCETALCGADGVCSVALAAGAQCSSNQDCTEIYNSTAYTCGSDCLCTNISSTSNVWVDFSPQNTTSPDFVIPVLAPSIPDGFRYLIQGGYVQIYGSVQFTNISLVTDTYYGFIDIDISNLPFVLDTTPNSPTSLGDGTLTPNTTPHETAVLQAYINSGTSFGFYVTFPADPGTNWGGINNFEFLFKLS